MRRQSNQGTKPPSEMSARQPTLTRESGDAFAVRRVHSFDQSIERERSNHWWNATGREVAIDEASRDHIDDLARICTRAVGRAHSAVKHRSSGLLEKAITMAWKRSDASGLREACSDCETIRMDVDVQAAHALRPTHFVPCPGRVKSNVTWAQPPGPALRTTAPLDADFARERHGDEVMSGIEAWQPSRFRVLNQDAEIR